MSDTPRTDAAYKAMVEGECLPGCDSHGHEELCPYVNGENVMAEFARQLERELNRVCETHKALMAEADRRLEMAWDGRSPINGGER